MSNTVKIDVATLTEELAWITKGKTSSYGLLNNVEIAAIVGGLRLRRTDYELFRESMLGGDGGGQSRLLIDPGRLGMLLRGAKGDAAVEVGDQHLTVAVGGKTVKLQAAGNADEFPDWPVFTPVGEPAVLGAPQIARAMTSVGTDDTLPMLTGVRFDPGTMASTDRFRLSVIGFDGPKKGFTALIQATAFRPFISQPVVITVESGAFAGTTAAGADGNGAARISNGGRSILVRCLDAEFPKYRQLIPDEKALLIDAAVRRDELLDAIGPILSDVTWNVTLTLREDTMTVSTGDANGEMTIDADISATVVRGDELPFTVRLAAKNLVECVKALSDNVVRFSASHPAKPVLLRCLADDELHLVMPVRMPS